MGRTDPTLIEPPVPKDMRCIVCGNPITSTPREGTIDAFCKSVCAKQFFGTQALSGAEHMKTGPKT